MAAIWEKVVLNSGLTYLITTVTSNLFCPLILSASQHFSLHQLQNSKNLYVMLHIMAIYIKYQPSVLFSALHDLLEFIQKETQNITINPANIFWV